jgi:hypothetical protein
MNKTGSKTGFFSKILEKISKKIISYPVFPEKATIVSKNFH